MVMCIYFMESVASGYVNIKNNIVQYLNDTNTNRQILGAFVFVFLPN